MSPRPLPLDLETRRQHHFGMKHQPLCDYRKVLPAQPLSLVCLRHPALGLARLRLLLSTSTLIVTLRPLDELERVDPELDHVADHVHRVTHSEDLVDMMIPHQTLATLISQKDPLAHGDAAVITLPLSRHRSLLQQTRTALN